MQLRVMTALAGLSVALGGCMQSKKLASSAPKPAKILVAEIDHDWLRYKIYCMAPAGQPLIRSRQEKNRSASQLVFSIMIINMKDGTSPLRKRCRDLADYNLRYEYLLNLARNDLQLVYGDAVVYPAYFSFENNYNTLPFETINVGYNLPAMRRGPAAGMTLVFADPIFSQDTIRCAIPAASGSH